MGKLHDDAAKAYNAKLSSLFMRLHTPPREPSKSGAPLTEKGDTHVVQKYGPREIVPGSYREYLIDSTGERKGCNFDTSRGFVGISGEDHDALQQITRRIASDRAYRDAVSSDFVYEKCIDWLKNKYERPDDVRANFTDYLEEVTTKTVRRFEVWLPIPIVQIMNPFDIGLVTFRRITKEMMDEWAERSNIKSSAKAEAVFDRMRSRLQSATAACVTVEAEPIRGNELALERSEASISILRLACPAMLNAHQWAPIDPSLIDRLGASIMLHVENRKIVGQQNSLHERMLPQWLLRKEDIERHTRTLWGFGHNLLMTERNEFQELLLGALIHYSRSVLKADTAERLLYIVTALESVFIKDANESIIQNLRERIAAFGGKDQADRLKILKLIGKVYELRSGFVHRAIPVSDMSQFQEFVVDAWSTFLFLINNYNKWLTKSDFLRMVDEQKFSGPMFSTEGIPPV
jgi:hypothetical protein